MVVHVYVNREIVEANAKNGANDPPLSILKNGQWQVAHEVNMTGPARLIYRRGNPFKPGPRVWIECEDAAASNRAS